MSIITLISILIASSIVYVLFRFGIDIWQVILYWSDSRRLKKNRRRYEELEGRSQPWALESFYDDSLLEEHHKEMQDKYKKNGRRWKE